jgi:hypothetical protein
VDAAFQKEVDILQDLRYDVSTIASDTRHGYRTIKLAR